MIKNIILIDNIWENVNWFLENTTYTIFVLVVGNDELKVKYSRNPRIINIFTIREIRENNDVKTLSYDIIEEYRALQPIVENASDRILVDYQYKKDLYYRGLSFWIDIFEQVKVNAVIFTGVNHGGVDEGPAYAIAKKNNIPVYLLEPIFVGTRAIKYANDDIFLPFKEVRNVDISSAKDYIMPYDINLENVLKDKFSIQNKLLLKLAKLVNGKFGILGLEFILCIKKMKFTREVTSVGYQYNYFEKVRKYRQLQNTKKYLAKKSTNIKSGEKYIFYAMHFEPEGSLTARVTLESQLIIIRMITQALPEDWRLYVKEHPHQYKLNNMLMEYYIHSANYYKSRYFYEILECIKKVRLLKSEISSQEVMEHAQAVATINGTIALEAIDINLPIMLFGGSSTILSKLQDVFNIKSYKNCEDAVKQIVKGMIPDYTNVDDLINKYVEVENEHGVAKMLEAITSHIERFE